MQQEDFYQEKRQGPAPRLSVIMPVYNAQDTVSRSVDSFLHLSEALLHRYGLQSRLYIVDDYSADDTVQVINQILQFHDQITLIKNNKNLGPGLSRNKALSLIKDGYVGFLDADDEIVSDGYINAYIEGIKRDSDWITFNGWFCDGSSRKSKYDFDRLTDNTQQLATRCRKGELDGSIIFTIYSSKLLRDNKLRFPAGYYEDISFAYEALLAAETRYIVDVSGYRKHSISTSIVNTISERHINGFIDAWLRVDAILEKYDSPDFQFDRTYGFYGYVANLVSSIVLSGYTNQDKERLFSLLFSRVELELESQNSNYPIKTKKDRLTKYFLESFPLRKGQFIPNISTFYEDLFN